MKDQIQELPKVDVVWCSALLEHVESIHIFLRKISFLLKPDGLIVIYVPTIPLIPALKYIPGLNRYTTGYLYSDHINAFTPSTLRFSVSGPDTTRWRFRHLCLRRCRSSIMCRC